VDLKLLEPTLSISVIIPTYREVDNLKKLLPLIDEALSGYAPGYEVIIVDDDSRDGTEDAVKALRDAGLPVILHVRRQERGLATAVVYGMTQAKGDVLLCMDADLSHPPERIPDVVEPLLQADAPDFVIGSRFTPGGAVDQSWGWPRRLNSWVATLLCRPLLNMAVRDPMAGFFALPKAVFSRCERLKPVGYKIGLEIMLRCGCRSVREVPITFRDREAGESKLSLREQLNYLKHLSLLYEFRYPAAFSLAAYCGGAAVGLLFSLLLLLLLVVVGRFAPLPARGVLLLAYAPALAVSAVQYARRLRAGRGKTAAGGVIQAFLGPAAFECLAVAGVVQWTELSASLALPLGLALLVALGALARAAARKSLGQGLRGPVPGKKPTPAANAR